ncbi:MAG TPA: glycoside hydrolase family 15 protein [Chloroflexota bacterium]|jgi:alpha,alpha-trehalase|nr:glycoside hydrolase family 15 protein [Chloroflexota bacterium]
MVPTERPRYTPIADYALIGNCHTAALVSRDGSVDWWCPRRFDSPAVLCRLLDAERGGSLRIGGHDGRVQRRYVGPTNVLETTYEAGENVLRVTDFMPLEAVRSDHSSEEIRAADRIARMVEAVSGEPTLELTFRPSFDYAGAAHEMSILSGGAVARAAGAYLTLAAPGVVLESDGAGGVRGRLTARPGERYWVTLTHSQDEASARAALEPGDTDAELKVTLDYWQQWSERCRYRGPYRDAVLRSALVLKLLTYEPSGAIIAAPTTSLPESVGGVRNWDYRYTWLRDASLMLYALLTLGYHGEAADFFEWLERVEQANPEAAPQIMYAVGGECDLPEQTLDHLEGYRSSRPVRVGNAASGQRQLDIFGEVVGSAYLYFSAVARTECDPSITEPSGGPTAETWSMLRGLVEQAARSWQLPDRGIWEVRGEPKLFLYSRLRCWNALDRGIKLAEKFRLPAPLDSWRHIREQVRGAILERGYDARQGAFTQAFDSPELDASSLVIPRIGFLPATDPRVQSTIDRTRETLTRNGLVDRYRNADGVPGDEASFAMCTYWLVDALALAGRIDEAAELFEHVTGYANDLGLLSEEIDPGTGELLGNFPQGFSHMALIGSAVNLAKASRHGAETKRESEAGRVHVARQAASKQQM